VPDLIAIDRVAIFFVLTTTRAGGDPSMPMP
jgi:hypothetical protein